MRISLLYARWAALVSLLAVVSAPFWWLVFGWAWGVIAVVVAVLYGGAAILIARMVRREQRELRMMHRALSGLQYGGRVRVVASLPQWREPEDAA